MSPTIKFRRLDPRAVLPSRGHPGDAGLDLSCIEPVDLRPGERVAVRTGLAVAIPHGCAGLVLPRSGLARRHGIGLVNAPGLIDSGYRGEIEVLLINTDATESFSIDAGSRIAQLVVLDCSHADAGWSEALDDGDRGSDGFGSTGTD